MHMNKKVDDILERYQQSVWTYYRKKQKFDKIQKQFAEAKERFEQDMLECSDQIGKKRMCFSGDQFDSNSEADTLNVTRVEKVSIEWFAEKLERKLPKPVAKKVIRKQYRIRDMRGLTAYLKSCGVDPKVFKTFIDVERTVDQKAVDQLGEVGEISVNQIAGCYVVKCLKPYFTLKVKKGEGSDVEEEER